MKKIIALILILCMLPVTAVAEGEVTQNETNRIYIFGDDWAKEWGDVLPSFLSDEVKVINHAEPNALLSGLDTGKYDVKKGDLVILSYGIMEKDRISDKNADFKKNLEAKVDEFLKKGAEVMFVSICSSMRYNTMTGNMEETRNFFTETVRSYAKTKKLTYVDLAKLTATWANKLGAGQVGRLYTSVMSLSENGRRMCAYEVMKSLAGNENFKDKVRNNLYQVKSYSTPMTSFDVFFESEITKRFKVYIKNGNGVSVNSAMAPNGDSVVIAESVNGMINITGNWEKAQVSCLFEIDAEDFATTEKPFEKSFLPGVYDVSVRKTEPLKASVYLNGYLIASNLDMPGTQPVPEAAEHTFREYHLDENKISMTVTGLTDKLDYVNFAPSAVIYDKKPRIFVGGDSTVCNYYPLERTGQEIDGTVMTGWAMLLHKYVDAEVINLAASGDWAANWLEKSFPIVEKEGKPGDIFVVQFGINDHDKSTVEEMRAALSEMIDRCVAKGIIPVLVSPQISAGYGWGDESDIGKSDGGAYEEFFTAVRTLSEEKGCFYVDLTDLSSGWFSEIGRENVYKKYHLWDYENDKPKDMMHLSYKGADAMCRFFVMGLKKISDSNASDKWGNNLSSLTFW